MGSPLDQISAAVRKLAASVSEQGKALQSFRRELIELRSRPRTITEEIDAIAGRRAEFSLHAEVAFSLTDNGNRGQPATVTVSQDGPFIWTHYPLVGWRPTAPNTATNLQRWRPVASFPLPDQVVDADIIDLSYEIQDGGNQRNFQNSPRGPMFSRPDNMVPLPVPTLFAPNATIQFIPTYNAITWDSAVPPTAGVLVVDFPGYRIVNL